jgi:2-succinyl-5-enolpyruvyl-6-hydroxy-3-cyclohexene-1-carboxylate synthase
MTDLNSFLSRSKQLLVIVAELPFLSLDSVEQFLMTFKCPMIIESLSQLRQCPTLYSRIINDDDVKLDDYTHILRIGGMPVTSVWRQLSKRSDIEIVSLSHLPFVGLPNGQLIEIETDYRGLSNFETNITGSEPNTLVLKKECCDYDASPHSEKSMIHYLSQQIPRGSMIYLGNSLSIRHWEKGATYDDKAFKLYGSRGVNGIDGQLSTFLGAAQPNIENWCIVGDLTALYDLNAPWILSQIPDLVIRIVIIHNGGGQIFSTLFPKHPSLLNEHNIQFKDWATMWTMDYLELKDVRNLDINQLAQRQVIVLKPLHTT